jgi:hypothetical protein
LDRTPAHTRSEGRSEWSSRSSRVRAGAQGLYGWLARAAVAASERPFHWLGVLLTLNLALSAAFVALGYWVIGDQAELFRELAPGSWLSFFELVFLAVVAWSVHERVATGSGWRRLDDFWGLSAVVFAVFAFDEITQATIFLSDLLELLGASAPGGFSDLQAFLLSMLFVIAGLVLVRRVPALFRHPRAVALLAAGIALGVASQALDSLFEATSWEFVAEECLKLAAEPFFIAAYLVALNETPARDRRATAR